VPEITDYILSDVFSLVRNLSQISVWNLRKGGLYGTKCQLPLLMAILIKKQNYTTPLLGICQGENDEKVQKKDDWSKNP
jgi:hypothetical protein